jgi:hypothetical protein
VSSGCGAPEARQDAAPPATEEDRRGAGRGGRARQTKAIVRCHIAGRGNQRRTPEVRREVRTTAVLDNAQKWCDNGGTAAPDKPDRSIYSSL